MPATAFQKNGVYYLLYDIEMKSVLQSHTRDMPTTKFDSPICLYSSFIMTLTLKHNFVFNP